VALIAATAAALVLMVGGLVRAQQTDYHLDDGDDLTINCPTRLTIEYTDEGGAVVNCAAEAEDASALAAADETPSSR